MSKFPHSPGVAALRAIAPKIAILAAGTRLARIYSAAGAHPVAWNEFRRFGPLDARWDHHLPGRDGLPRLQARSILYAALDGETCVAEAFQLDRTIDRVATSPWLVVFALARPVRLLDLSGPFATRIGASTAIHSGPRSRAREWARDLYDAYPKLHGIQYASSMNGGKPAVALNERIHASSAFPRHPLANRPLGDDALADMLETCAESLGYSLS